MVRVPARFHVQYWRDNAWTNPPVLSADTPAEGRRAYHVSFPPVSTSRVRIVFVPQSGSALGLSEIEASGFAKLPLTKTTAPPRDLAYNADTAGYPRASASFTSPHDRVHQVNDMQVAFTKYSRNRWTGFQSPNARDWVAIDFGTPKLVRRIELYLFGDDGGIKAPRGYTVQFWTGAAWRDARVLSRLPERPLASAVNVVTIEAVRTSRLRVTLEHDLPAFAGITELIVR